MANASVEISLGELSTQLGATLRGDQSFVVNGVSSLGKATHSQISFLSSEKYQSELATSNAGAVVLSQSSADMFSGNVLITEDPYLAYAKLSQIFDTRIRQDNGVHASASVADSAVIGENVSIGANCVIGANVVIGAGSEIHPGVVIYENSRLGANCLIYANVCIYSNVSMGNNVTIHTCTTIGSDGFGYAPSKEGWVKIHQLGGVLIGNNVEIGASCSIDRGAIDNTIIDDGVIIDNQVHIAHNVEIGRCTAIAGCTGIAGSTRIGKNCTVAGMVAINGHIDIADNTHFHGGTVVTKGNKSPGAFASAAPIQPVKQWQRNSARFRQLDDFASRLKVLEKASLANKK